MNTEAIADTLEVDMKPKKRGRLSKLAPKLPKEPAPSSQADAIRGLRLLVAQYEMLRESSKKSKQRSGDRKNKETGEVLVNRLPEDMKETLRQQDAIFSKAADQLESRMKRILATLPVYTLFLLKVRGIGTVTSAKLVADIDIHRCVKVSAMHQVCGLSVYIDDDGKPHAQRPHAPTKIEIAKKKAPLVYHNRLKVGLFQAWTSLAKDRTHRDESPYYRRGMEYKHRLQSSPRFQLLDKWETVNGKKQQKATFDGKPGGRSIINTMTWRPAMQLFTEHLYIVWRTLEGLPVWPSYEAAKLGYAHGGKVCVNAPKMLTIEEALRTVGVLGADDAPEPIEADDDIAAE